MTKFSPVRLPSGTVIQGGIPKTAPDPNGNKPNGLLMRGVVIATYVLDDEKHPYKDDRWETVGIYCDVLVYSGLPRGRARIVNSALVPQSRGGIHNGHIWKPKAAKLDVSGNSLNTRVGTDPADMDGDHVLIGFMDNDFALPVIIGGVPHPRADLGNEEAGRQLKLKLEDGDPDFWKHHGTLYGIDKEGNFLVDTRFANDGKLADDGKEPEPSEDKGNVKFQLPSGTTFTIEIDDDSTKHVAVVEYLKELYNDLKSYVENAQVMTAMGPSGTISAQSGPGPEWDTAIESNRVIIPDNE
jgi:hypothetical protein